MKYSSRSKIKEEAESPDAIFAWKDFIRISSLEKAKAAAKKENPFTKLLAIAPDAPDTLPPDHPPASPPPPRVVGNGMSAEELRRRVMGGGTTEVEDLVDRGASSDRGFSSTRSFQSQQAAQETQEKEKEEDILQEAQGRFGRYREPAMPREEQMSILSDYGVRVDQEGWLPSFVMGAPLMVDLEDEVEENETPETKETMWRKKKGFVAQGDLFNCDGELDADAKSCMLEMDLGEGRKGSFMIDTASKDFTDRIRNRKLQALAAGAKPVPVLESGITVDGVLDSNFLSQYDLDIDFSRQAAAFFQPGSLLRHNPSIQCGQQIDLPLENSNGPLTVRARLRRNPEPGVFQTEEDFQEIVAVVSTRHPKSLITPKAAARFKRAPFFQDNIGYDYRLG
mmetsp:Transcript_2207/g.4215  ORF Transcript_2207/g.4215 Transcript_2207/m.4215 type:complete len:395 (+) Transcript_2207:83-1267(+)